MLVSLYGMVEEVEEPHSVSCYKTLTEVRALEGRHVNLALADGSRIDDCQLISAGRGSADTVWIFTNGLDTFVPLADIVDAWEATPSRSRAA
jgi:hypothetical protein